MRVGVSVMALNPYPLTGAKAVQASEGDLPAPPQPPLLLPHPSSSSCLQSIMEVMGPHQPVCKPSYFDFCLTAIEREVKRALLDTCERSGQTCHCRGGQATGQQQQQRPYQAVESRQAGNYAVNASHKQWEAVISYSPGAIPPRSAAAACGSGSGSGSGGGGNHSCSEPISCCPRRQSFHIIAFGLWLSRHWFDMLQSIATHFRQRHRQRSGGRCCCGRRLGGEGSDSGGGSGTGNGPGSGQRDGAPRRDDDVSSGGPCMPLLRITAVDFNVVSVSDATEPMMVMAGRYLELVSAATGLTLLI